MMHSAEIVDDNMVVEGYEEIAVDDMNDMSELVVTNEDGESLHYEDDHEDQDYGGMPIEQYNDIVRFKRDSDKIPSSVDRRIDRSAPSHWRARCKCFSMADDGETLLYYNPENAANVIPKVVVKKGEVRRVLERVHELIGHLGQKRTQMVVLRKLYWRSVRQDVKTFIASCDFCTEKKLQGRKIVKAPVDITSENFDISVSVRNDTPNERLEFQLVGYNETEVREAAYTRMTSYTFKETANEYRSRYANTPAVNKYETPAFRRQPYVKKHNNQSVGYLLPFQQRSRTMEPEFIEVFGREVYHPEMMYDAVVPEMDDGIMRSREAMEKRKENHLTEAQPITLLGNLLLAKNFKTEENDVNFQPPQQEDPSPSRAGPSSSDPKRINLNRGYNQKRMMDMEDHDPDDVHYSRHHRHTSPPPTTTASLVKKRRREAPSIRGMASRFSLAIGESDRLDNNEVNRSNPHLIEYPEPSSILRGDASGLPPVIMAPSTNDEVCKLQIEALQRHIHLQKMQEKLLQEQYEQSLRIPITRYIQQEEEVQEETLEVDHVHEMNVIGEHHQVYEEEVEEVEEPDGTRHIHHQ